MRCNRGHISRVCQALVSYQPRATSQRFPEGTRMLSGTLLLIGDIPNPQTRSCEGRKVCWQLPSGAVTRAPAVPFAAPLASGSGVWKRFSKWKLNEALATIPIHRLFPPNRAGDENLISNQPNWIWRSFAGEWFNLKLFQYWHQRSDRCRKWCAKGQNDKCQQPKLSFKRLRRPTVFGEILNEGRSSAGQSGAASVHS